MPVAAALAAIAGVVSQIQSITDAARAAIEARDTALFQQKADELNAQIFAARQLALTAQEAQAALVKRERELEEETARLKAWSTEKLRYELYEVAPGRFCYKIKEECRDFAPSHKICAYCYEDARRMILQENQLTPGRAKVLDCLHCEARIYIEGQAQSGHPAVSGRRRR